MWKYLLVIVIIFVLFLVMISKLEKKTEIINHEDD
ncbi:competence protein ComGC [Staphylococcus saprophyticus]